MENSSGFPKKLYAELTYDQSIPLPGIYLKEMKRETPIDTCEPMFTPALFTMAKSWKLPKSLSTNEWTNKTYTQQNIIQP